MSHQFEFFTYGGEVTRAVGRCMTPRCIGPVDICRILGTVSFGSLSVFMKNPRCVCDSCFPWVTISPPGQILSAAELWDVLYVSLLSLLAVCVNIRVVVTAAEVLSPFPPSLPLAVRQACRLHAVCTVGACWVHAMCMASACLVPAECILVALCVPARSGLAVVSVHGRQFCHVFWPHA